MDKNLLSCSRVSARLVVHQIAELQLTAPLQKSASKFYRFALKLVSGSFGRYFVLVL